MLKRIEEQPDDSLSPQEPNLGPVKRWPTSTWFQRRLLKIRTERLESDATGLK